MSVSIIRKLVYTRECKNRKNPDDVDRSLGVDGGALIKKRDNETEGRRKIATKMERLP